MTFVPITERAEAAAEAIIRGFVLVPATDGGVQLESHAAGVDIEITFDPDGTPRDICVGFAKTPEP